MGFVFDSESRTTHLVNAASGPLIFTAIIGPLTPDDVDRMDARARAVRAQHKRVAVITLVSKSTPMPDKVTRERAAEVTKRADAGGLDIVVLTSGGLWSSAARAVLTGIYLFSGKLDEHRVVTSLDEAVQMVAKDLPYDLDKVRAAATAFAKLVATPAAA